MDPILHEGFLHMLQSFSKILINLACGLNHSKDLRDFFLDILEKVNSWNIEYNLVLNLDSDNFFNWFINVIGCMPVLGRNIQM